jgi:hypothetical protein
MAYICPLFEQNGGDSLFQEEDNLIPQRFNSSLWIAREKPFKTDFCEEKLNEKRRKTN